MRSKDERQATSIMTRTTKDAPLPASFAAARPALRPGQPQVGPAFARPQSNPSRPAAPGLQQQQPTPNVLQRKTALPAQPPVNHKPAAPPVYRPQPAPRVLQQKAIATSPSAASQANRAPVAPPVYRPQPAPKVLQTKRATAREAAHPLLSSKTPGAPTVHKAAAASRVSSRPNAALQPHQPLCAPVRRDGFQSGANASCQPRAAMAAQRKMALPARPPAHAALQLKPESRQANPPGTVKSSVVQLFPVKAKWGPEDADLGGSWMEAFVGRDDNWWYGTGPPGSVPDVIDYIGTPIKQRYVAGHLLNDNMTGYGVNENLTVITDDANKLHRGVEGKIKALCIYARQKEDFTWLRSHDDPNGDYEYGCWYRVVVNPPNPNGTENYASERYLAASITVTARPVKFLKTAKKKDLSTAEDWDEQTPVVMALWNGNQPFTKVIPNVPPYPPMPGTAGVKRKYVPKTTNTEEKFDVDEYNKNMPFLNRKRLVGKRKVKPKQVFRF